MTTKSLLSGTALAKCMLNMDEEYKERFIQTMSDVYVSISKPTEYFDEEIKMYRNKYFVYIKRGDKKISFVFHDSANNHNIGDQPDLYDIMTCVANDGMNCTLEFENFQGFCDEYDYDPEERKSYRIWINANRQQKKIREMFDEKELEAMPQ